MIKKTMIDGEDLKRIVHYVQAESELKIRLHMLLEKQKEIKSELESIKGVARSASILKNSATTYYQTLTKEEKDMVNKALRELNMKI